MGVKINNSTIKKAIIKWPHHRFLAIQIASKTVQFKAKNESVNCTRPFFNAEMGCLKGDMNAKNYLSASFIESLTRPCLSTSVSLTRIS